jgi:predicted dienelactone hydrolase
VNTARRDWLLAAGAASAVALATLAPRARAATPAAAASADVAVHDLDWQDRHRDRGVPVRLHWPRHALGEVPLVLYSHGFGGERRHAPWLGPVLAANGIACAHVQHVGSDHRVWMSGPPEWILRELRGEGMALERLARIDDMRFVLDRLLTGTEWAPRLDRRCVAVAGHSLGAKTALLLGGAQLPTRQGRQLRDVRFSGAVIIGVAAFAGFDTARIVQTVQLPTLHLTTEEDKTSMPGYAATVEDRVAWFRATGTASGAGGPPKATAVFSHGRHAIFNDAGPSDPVAAAAGGAVLAFLRSLWHADARALPAWRERAGSLVTRFELQGSLHRQPFGVTT